LQYNVNDNMTLNSKHMAEKLNDNLEKLSKESRTLLVYWWRFWKSGRWSEKIAFTNAV